MFALVDCNSFYVSCERVFRPDLRNKPVVVLSNNDGCVISRSDEAKKVGVPMGAPAFKFEDFFKENKVHVFSSNYPLYGDMSARVMNTLFDFTPDVEIYSIDEAFLKFSGFENFDLQRHGEQIRATILKNIGLPVCVGIAPTKTLAKTANHIAKKFKEKTKGVYLLDDKVKIEKALKWIDIQDVWGVGRGNTKRLFEIGVKKAYDFTQVSDIWIMKNMGVIGLRMKNELLGEPMLDLEEALDEKKSIATTRSFEYTYSDYENLKERVSTFAVSCAEKLRKQKSCCSMIMVFLKTDRHKKNAPQYRNSFVYKILFPTNSSIDLAKYAEKCLAEIYLEGFKYKKAGVVVMDIVPESSQQLHAFEKKNPKHTAAMKSIDAINKYIGHDKIKLASQDLKRTWKMRQEKLSPKYSTNINDIIEVKVY
jgi:DNA polymerase V